MSSNRFLDSLSFAGRSRLLSMATEADLPVNTPLYGARELPTDVFFLTSGFASQVITLSGSGSAEVGLIGREGLVGHLALLGASLPADRCFMQASGTGYRIPFASFQEAFRNSADVRERVLEFAQEHTLAVAHLAACNMLHSAESRLARWLLMVEDRLETDLLPLTQEFLAQMLGTRRMTVTAAAGVLQRGGLIEYKRGRVRILQRQKLEEAACECYGHLKAAFAALYVPE